MKYIDAIEALEAELRIAKRAGYPYCEDPYAQAIRRALKIAHALEQEPTQDMYDAGGLAFNDRLGMAPACTASANKMRMRKAFIAMRNQLIKEAGE